MHADPKSHTLDLTRRGMLRDALVIAGAGCLMAAGATAAGAAQSKMAQKLVNYRPTPFGKAECDVCSQWQAPDGCKVVQGPLSPKGWCSLYAPKS
jgi:hypothetical protein